MALQRDADSVSGKRFLASWMVRVMSPTQQVPLGSLTSTYILGFVNPGGNYFEIRNVAGDGWILTAEQFY